MRMFVFTFAVSALFLSNAWGVTNLQTCFSPQDNCDQVIIGYIKSAKKTIDMAIYNLSLDGIHNALSEAKKNGVKIRVLCDRGEAQTKNSQILDMISEGFDIRYGSQKGLMHNKFTVVDGTWVETGSYNYSYSATNLNAENQIYLNDNNVVSRYTSDFENVWGSGLPTDTAL
jgi:phosphatidylserine/phosphatidylglycerophosphate/cardiolipin synthase-like enzyme